MFRTLRHALGTTLVLAAAAAAALAFFVWSGLYDFGADAPHTAPVSALIGTMRERSVAVRAARLTVPDLADSARVVQGAGNYAAMCAGCHLTPGVERSELHAGLYPQPPRLARKAVDAARAFWIVKHGIKASGMPAWGRSMDDDSIWSLVAFLQKLPQLDASQYEQLVARSSGHSHGGGGDRATAGSGADRGPAGPAHATGGPTSDGQGAQSGPAPAREGPAHGHPPRPGHDQPHPHPGEKP